MDGTSQAGIAVEGTDRIWVASSGGALAFNRIDSTYARLFKNDGLPEQDLTAVAIDAAGNRWFGSRARGLQVQSLSGVFLSRPLDQFDTGSDSVRALAVVGDSVWVGMASGAALVTHPPNPNEPSDAVILTFNIEAFLGQSPLVNAIAARGDTTWFATQRGVVQREPDGSRSLVNAGLTNLDIRALAFFDGYLWAGTATSVFRLDDLGNGVWVEHAQGLAANRPFLAFAVFAQTLHVGALAGAQSIYRLEGMTWTPLTSGIGNRNVVGLAPGAGTLWAATNAGLYALDAGEVWQRLPSPDPPAPDGFPFNADYRDVAVIPQPQRARAVTGVFVTELTETGWRGVRRGQQNLEAKDIFRILVDRQGRTWLGHCCCNEVATCGVERLDTLDPTSNAVRYAAFNILALAEAPDGRIWAGSVNTDVLQGNGLYRIHPGTGAVDQFTSADGLASNSIKALAFDDRGRLWIGNAEQGVDLWSNPGTLPAAIVHIGPAQGLPNRFVNAIVMRGEETWIGTASGIGVFSGTSLVRVITGSALPDPQVLDLAVDTCGRVWAATNVGLVGLDGEGQIVAVFDHDAEPGVVDERLNTLDIDPTTATLWLATQNGLSRFAYDRSCSGSGGSERACDRVCPYPNPFRLGGGEVLSLTDLEAVGSVDVTVLDVTGHEVWSGRVDAAGSSTWDGRDLGGDFVPSGIYLLRVSGAGGASTPLFRRLAVLR